MGMKQITLFKNRVHIIFIFVVVGFLITVILSCRKSSIDHTLGKLDPFIEKAFSLDMAPGMCVAVVKDQDIIYAKGFGWADIETQRPVIPETMFYIASTTKSFTALAAALLDNRGELDLDEPINHYLPELELQPPLSSADITLRELLTHTHGIEAGGPVVFRTAYSGVHTHHLLTRLLGTYKPASTGKTFRYGNIGYNLASLVMDTRLEVSWKDVLHKEIFLPLRMKNTSAYLSKVNKKYLAMPYTAEKQGYSRYPYTKSDDNMHAAGGIVSSGMDLANWLIANINYGCIKNRPIFPKGVVLETHRIQANQDRKFGNFHRYGWGFGWDLGTYEGDTLIHRFGGFPGFRSHVSFMPRFQMGVVVLVNESGLGSHLADMIATYIYDILNDKPQTTEKYETILEQYRIQAITARKRIGEDWARRALRPQTLPYPFKSYVGIYENPKYGRMEWVLNGGKLKVNFGLLRSEVEVYDGDKNRFRVELIGRGQVIEFSFQGDLPNHLTYSGHKFDKVEHE